MGRALCEGRLADRKRRRLNGAGVGRDGKKRRGRDKGAEKVRLGDGRNGMGAGAWRIGKGDGWIGRPLGGKVKRMRRDGWAARKGRPKGVGDQDGRKE
ncbi:hypothetical protein BIFGAL_04032 [Bifidobacterium gallicum DSM 20093 = LMG 11596]|uniref:Uncharacterized protein n=1 Tax=Bifidobacterium gallicum DSM 20093 = LMG 11596 TaxID=561180 RepID=D1NVY8_9BIFI|nr:hypothetical protein BIFGAL_04032 [Bifidobacterium gallicum DSM 20093 = LMG 11596]